MKRVLSGIRATGRLHVGNYYGMVKGMLGLQEDDMHEPFFMVADLHAMTTPFKPDKLKENVQDVVLDYLSAGLDPEKSVLFLQSQVPEHTELAYYLSTAMTIARLSHLPTYKDKVKQYPENNTLALLSYPVLMSADILLYKTDALPVGDDQIPHLEVARELARKMNDQYGMDFPEPKQMKTEGAYVPSLTGEGKMSKSVEGSYISLTDGPDDIRSKLASAPTDSGKGEKIPEQGGVANLLKLVELFEGIEKRKGYENKYTSEGIKYSELKADLGDAIYAEIEPIQKRRKVFEKDPTRVESILEAGAKKAREVAENTVLEVKQKMGLS